MASAPRVRAAVVDQGMVAALSITVFVLLWTGFVATGVLVWRTIRRLEDEDGPWYQGL